MLSNPVTPSPVFATLNNEIHFLNYPVWIFDERSLRIVDANKQAIEFCRYEEHELIGLSIMELWHNEDLLNVLNDLVTEHYERSFFGSLKHRKKDGEMVIIHVRATRLKKSKSLWVVHLVKRMENETQLYK